MHHTTVMHAMRCLADEAIAAAAVREGQNQLDNQDDGDNGQDHPQDHIEWRREGDEGYNPIDHGKDQPIDEQHQQQMNEHKLRLLMLKERARREIDPFRVERTGIA